jgi:hypothetical protein
LIRSSTFVPGNDSHGKDSNINLLEQKLEEQEEINRQLIDDKKKLNREIEQLQ